MTHSFPYTLTFDRIHLADLPHVGGKGANLGEMTQAGFPIPPGFCVTTAAFQDFLATCAQTNELYQLLETITADNLETTRHIGQQVRHTLAQVPIPTEISQAILAAWEVQGSQHSYAVRSSATAEDLPDASFAGQQDTFLNVQGADDLLQKVRRCWISLFTDRAILYRHQNGFSHQDVHLSVVIQRMVQPDISGILFTADPVTGHRHILSIDASYGLGEALVAGLVSPDLYKVDKRSQTILETKIGDKQIAIRSQPGGGTYQETLPHSLRSQTVLTPAQIIELTQIAVQIETHYDKPQDIEWCLENGHFYIVQSRPITSLFPLPHPRPAHDALHVYISFNHAQVMTDPMPPMAHTIWQLLMPVRQPQAPPPHNPYCTSAGGRIYVDLTPALHLPLPRRIIPKFLTMADQLIAQALREVIDRDAFKKGAAHFPKHMNPFRLARWLLPLLGRTVAAVCWRKPEGTTDRVSRQMDTYLAQVRAQLAAASPGAARLKTAYAFLDTIFMGEAIHMPPYLMAGMIAKTLLTRLAQKRGDVKDVDTLTRGLSGNVTTEMDLKVGDLADAARQSAALVDHLLTQDNISALKTAAAIEGGPAFLAQWEQFLQTYGMRGPSEIDISRDRWRDDPSSLLRVVIGNLQHEQSGTHRRHHQQLQAEAEAAGERLVAVGRYGLLGPVRATITQRLVRVARNLLAIREHPKFLLIQFLGQVRTAVLEAGHILHDQNRLDQPTDIWFLTLIEAIAALENPAETLRPRITQRQAEMKQFKKMSPPRVITSDGEIPVVRHTNINLPPGAIAGSPVSSGVVEGIAKVVLDPTTETLHPGEILVAPFTDPGWTPLFINAAGLVMEVGGLMTHGSVVAREYGIPAVVAVPQATTQIKTGQYIRVHGDLGYVEILPNPVSQEVTEPGLMVA